MTRFRPAPRDSIQGDIHDPLAVGELIDSAFKPGHFFVAPSMELTWIAGRAETIPWELFCGRLVDANQTRATASFLSWQVGAISNEAILSVKFDVHARRIHVTRGFSAFAWQGFDSGGGAIESREVVQWTRELVGTIELARYARLENVQDELVCLLWQALVGTSRLPLHSVEAPLPAFTFGQLHYMHRSDSADSPCDSWLDFFRTGLQSSNPLRENVKLVEFALRCAGAADVQRVADYLADSFLRDNVPRLLRSLFNDVSLSPYTHFVDNALALVDCLQACGVLDTAARVDFLGHLLRQLSRHLAAYDLVTFHYRGANYPDALLLDSVLKRYLRDTEAQPALFMGDRGLVRRRALRQACLMRRHYEGLPVPDLPTSPGENARVMPASHPRVPEEQILQTLKRRKQLFADDALAALLTATTRHVLAASIADLAEPAERVELGLGVFIDRPLGYAKAPVEPDQTPMLAHEAFSPSLARRRWQELKNLGTELRAEMDAKRIDALMADASWPAGLPHTEVADCPRPVAALGDVRKVADDFVILRTMPGGLGELMGLFDWRPMHERYRLAFLAEGRIKLCVQERECLAVYDDQLRKRLELTVEASEGYTTRAGVEWPRAGLRTRVIWEDTYGSQKLARREVEVLVIPEATDGA